jgi:hypothetical protein
VGAYSYRVSGNLSKRAQMDSLCVDMVGMQWWEVNNGKDEARLIRFRIGRSRRTGPAITGANTPRRHFKPSPEQRYYSGQLPVQLKIHHGTITLPGQSSSTFI